MGHTEEQLTSIQSCSPPQCPSAPVPQKWVRHRTVLADMWTSMQPCSLKHRAWILGPASSKRKRIILSWDSIQAGLHCKDQGQTKLQKILLELNSAMRRLAGLGVCRCDGKASTYSSSVLKFHLSRAASCTQDDGEADRLLSHSPCHPPAAGRGRGHRS